MKTMNFQEKQAKPRVKKILFQKAIDRQQKNISRIPELSRIMLQASKKCSHNFYNFPKQSSISLMKRIINLTPLLSILIALMSDLPTLTFPQRQSCRHLFDSFDKYGYGKISMQDFLEINRTMGTEIPRTEIEQSLNYAGLASKDCLKIQDFEIIFRHVKKRLFAQQISEPYLDTFVSLGGKPDKTGNVDTKSLVRLLTGEFQMPINVQKLLNQLDQDRNGTVDFQQFKFLLR